MNIAEHLRALCEWEARTDTEHPPTAGGGRYYRRDGFELREFDDPPIEITDAARAFTDPATVVFLSRHRGETGRILTSHHTGNFGRASHGGAPRSLARAAPNVHAHLHRALRDTAPPGYAVGTECTHHGPTDLAVPSVFVEIGSDPAAWTDPEAGRAVARAVLTLRGVPPDREHTIVGVGGGHYAPRFDRIVGETDWAVGHIAADWSIDDAGGLSPDLVTQVFAKSNTSIAVTDGEHLDFAATADTLGYRVVTETWVRETGGVRLSLVADLERAMCPIDEGLRLGDHATDPGTYDLRCLNPALLDAVNGIDHDHARSVIHAHTLAYETTDAGTRATGWIAIPTPGALDRIADGLVRIFRDHGLTARRTDAEIHTEQRVFDPEKARRHGVPEGPAFGRLASGEPVENVGRTITPEMVHSTRANRYQLTTE